MIALITGTVRELTQDSLIVMVGGIGLRVQVPAGTLNASPAVGGTITLHTHLALRENDIALYGFAEREELDLFRLLIGVSGIGPRLALAILSTLSPDVLANAVSREEPEVLQRVPGVGKKTAQQILFQLRDKFKTRIAVSGLGAVSDLDAEVIAALTSLGYSVVEAQTAVQRLPRDPDLPIEERVRLALSQLGS